MLNRVMCKGNAQRLRSYGKLAGMALFCFVALSAFWGAVLCEGAFHLKRTHLSPDWRERARSTAAAWGAHVEDVAIESADGVILRGWYFRRGSSSGKAVILLHGQGIDRTGMSGYVPLFLKHSYDVLTPDSRAYGESGGDIATYGIREADDVNRWAEWLAARQSERCVFGLGESMGAGILLQALRDNHSLFCAVAAESPFASFREAAYDRVSQPFGGGWFVRTAIWPVIESGFLYARLQFGLNLNDASPEKTVAGSRVPVLLIHGTADDNILPENSEHILRRGKGHVTLWRVSGACHTCVLGAVPEEFERRVTDWFAAVCH